MNTRSCNLPWERIRWDYENTPLSMAGLVKKWGIKWANTVYRRKDAEGWQRNTAAIVASLTVEQVAATEDEKRRYRPTYKPFVERLTPEMIRDEADHAQMLSARQIAGLHASRIRSQMDVGSRVQAAGLAILERITRYLDGDTADQEALAQHLRRLGGLNPTSETLAGLVKAAAECIEKGIIMERRALGMDQIRGKVPPQDDLPGTVVGQGALALVKQVDLKVGTELREFAMNAMKRHREINGSAAEPS